MMACDARHGSCEVCIAHGRGGRCGRARCSHAGWGAPGRRVACQVYIRHGVAVLDYPASCVGAASYPPRRAIPIALAHIPGYPDTPQTSQAMKVRQLVDAATADGAADGSDGTAAAAAGDPDAAGDAGEAEARELSASGAQTPPCDGAAVAAVAAAAAGEEDEDEKEAAGHFNEDLARATRWGRGGRRLDM